MTEKHRQRTRDETRNRDGDVVLLRQVTQAVLTPLVGHPALGRVELPLRELQAIVLDETRKRDGDVVLLHQVTRAVLTPLVNLSPVRHPVLARV